MLDLNDFLYFVQVIDRGEFTATGRTLRIPKSTLSHRIQRLETEPGLRLLNRASRRFATTDAGESRLQLRKLARIDRELETGFGHDTFASWLTRRFYDASSPGAQAAAGDAHLSNRPGS